jgi:hypothetical protein
MRFCLFKAITFLFAIFFISGCGYTTTSLLSSSYKKIYVENFNNKIPITDETSDRWRYRTYRPLLEVDITKAIIDRFIFDGNLKISQRQDADLLLEGELVDFRREPTKYSEGDNVLQYRIAVVVNMTLKEEKDGKVLWQEKGFAGSEYYYTSGSDAKSEDSAVTDAIADLARRVVERVIEAW